MALSVRGRALSLRARLLLLVVASIVPLIGLGVAREAIHYHGERARVYDGLQTVARGTAIAVERDFQLRIVALETLALSPSLQTGDLDQFDAQAKAFLTRQPKDTFLGIATPDMQQVKVWGYQPKPGEALPRRTATAAGRQVFETGAPIIADLHTGHLSGLPSFSIDVPVFRDGKPIYDLFVRLSPDVLLGLIAGQHLPPVSVLTVIDASGINVARMPDPERFIGLHCNPLLWQQLQTHEEGIGSAPTLDGTPSIVAYSHIGTFGWSVAVGAPEEAIFAPLRRIILHIAAIGGLVLCAGLIAATVAARGITRPIDGLRRLAENDDFTHTGLVAASDLPETDMVAQALLRAATERGHVARALAESEQRFRTLFEQSPSGTILLDPETARVIDCNDIAAGFVGCTIEAFRGRCIIDFSPQTGAAKVWEICRSVASGQTWRYETRISGLSGPRDLLIAIAPARVSGRTLMLINQIDITDLRGAQADLRVNQERLELARQGADLGIWDWDIEHDTLTWSEHQWHLHGLQPRDVGPTPLEWAGIVRPADLHIAQDALRSALKNAGVPYRSEYSVIMPNGSLRRLLGRGQTIRDASGRAIRMVGINMDVTARYEAEMARDQLISALETERSRLSDIIEALPIGVGIIDSAGRVILGNAAVKRLIGVVIPSQVDAPQEVWSARHPDGSRIASRDFPGARALRGETVLPGQEFLYRGEAGRETWIRVGAIPLRWEDGRVQEAVIMLLDIDAEKRLLDIQQQVNARLEQRVREEVAAREAAQQRAAHAERMHALGQIAGGIAHDFNNVLQAVSGGAALIDRRPDEPDRVLRNARMIADAARRGAAITSRLLAFARRGDLRAEPVDAAALLTDMAEVLTHTLGGSVVCQVDVASALPPLFADRGQLETVLVNLATNARDAMPSGGTLTMAATLETVAGGTRHAAGLATGPYIRLAVRDTGLGMDRTVLARVTEPFFTTKEPGKGTGLGLAMAKGFAEQSGGSLSIESTEGEGTSIIMWLPVAGQAPPARGLERPVEPASVEESPRVLLVDDDGIVRQVLALSLEDSGFVVLMADSGVTALALLAAQERVDILVSDLTMPSMDGLTLIRQAQDRRPGLPAVLLTGYAGDGATLAVGGAISGAFSLLRKPVSGTQLVDRITALLASRKQASRA